jgi:hypothetical protein
MKSYIFVLFMLLHCLSCGQIDLKRGILRKRITNADSICIMGIETSSVILHAQRPYTRHNIKEKNKHRTVKINRVTAMKLRQDSLEVAVILDYEKLAPRPQGMGFDTTFIFAISEIKSITLWLDAIDAPPRNPRTDPAVSVFCGAVILGACITESITSFQKGETKRGINFLVGSFFIVCLERVMIQSLINKKKYKIAPKKWHILPPKIRRKKKIAQNKS